MRPGAGQQANTLPGNVRDYCTKYVNLQKLTLNAEEIVDGIYLYARRRTAVLQCRHQTDGCCRLLQNVTHPPTLQQPEPAVGQF